MSEADSLSRLFEGYGQTMTVSEVAELLKVGSQTVVRMVKDGRLTGYKPSGQLLLITSDVEQHLRDSKVLTSEK